MDVNFKETRWYSISINEEESGLTEEVKKELFDRLKHGEIEAVDELVEFLEDKNVLYEGEHMEGTAEPLMLEDNNHQATIIAHGNFIDEHREREILFANGRT